MFGSQMLAKSDTWEADDDNDNDYDDDNDSDDHDGGDNNGDDDDDDKDDVQRQDGCKVGRLKSGKSTINSLVQHPTDILFLQNQIDLFL